MEAFSDNEDFGSSESSRRKLVTEIEVPASGDDFDGEAFEGLPKDVTEELRYYKSAADDRLHPQLPVIVRKRWNERDVDDNTTQTVVDESTFQQDLRAAVASSFHRSSALSLPWERGYAARVLGKSPLTSTGLEWMNNQATMLFMPQPSKITPASTLRTPVYSSSSKRRMLAVQTVISDDELRNRALKTWRRIVELELQDTGVGRQLLDLCQGLHSEAVISNTLHDTFRSKSTATLVKRSGSFLGFLKFANDCGHRSILKFEEPFVYRYVCHLRERREAATKASSFLECVNFMIGVLNIPEARATMDSARIKGCTVDQFEAKRNLKQAERLTVDEVWKLENGVSLLPDVQDRVACGHFANNVFSCSRFWDSQWPDQVVKDFDSEGVGVITCLTKRHKTAVGQEKRTTLLPMTSLTVGLHVAPWGLAWMEARALSGLGDHSSPMLPAVGPGGTWQQRATTTSEASAWLRDLLIQCGVPKDAAIRKSTHSLKATLLSWLCLWGMPLEVRRIVGHHMDPGSKSALTYSRDAMSGPLAEIAKMIADIKSGTFSPDDSRSLRDLMRKNLRIEMRSSSVVQKVDSDDSDSDDEAAGGTDTGSSDDSDLSDSELRSPDSEDEIIAVASRQERGAHSCALFGEIVQHTKSGVLHAISHDEPDLLDCRRKLGVNYAKVHLANLKLKWPDCTDCLASQAKQSLML